MEEKEQARSESRARLASGRLPEQRRYRLFAGYGDGSLCDSCGCSIRTMDVLYEIVFEGTPQVIVTLHRECLPGWRGELRDRER
jgi:hypothetical protein